MTNKICHWIIRKGIMGPPFMDLEPSINACIVRSYCMIKPHTNNVNKSEDSQLKTIYVFVGRMMLCSTCVSEMECRSSSWLQEAVKKKNIIITHCFRMSDSWLPVDSLSNTNVNRDTNAVMELKESCLSLSLKNDCQELPKMLNCWF